MKKKFFALLALFMATMTASAYNLSVGTNEHGSVVFKVGQTPVTQADENDVVTVEVTADAGWSPFGTSGEWDAAIAAGRRNANPIINTQTEFTLTKVEGSDNKWQFTMGRANAIVNVTYRKLLSNTDITVSDIAAVTYNGSAFTPAITVSDGNTQLTQGTDYTVSYADNINASDTAKVIITAVPTSLVYAGADTVNFTINKKALELSFVADIDTLVYSGQAQTPEPALKYAVGQNDTLTLVKGTDYTIGYSNNTNAGTATATFTGQGNYSGTVSKSFIIAKKPVQASWIQPIPAQTWTGSNVTLTTEDLVVKDGNNTLVVGTDYTVTYKNNKANGNNTATVKVTGTGNYKGDASANFSIRKDFGSSGLTAWAVSTVDNPITYNGMQQTPPISVRDGRNYLVEGTDFTVEYGTNIAAGRGEFTVTGIGAYSGTKKAEFTINTRPIDDLEFVEVKLDSTAIDSAIVYTGAAQEPKLTITFTYNYKDSQNQDQTYIDTLLVGDNENGSIADFYATYENNVGHTDSAKVVIEGVNNYSNTRDFYFRIGKQPIKASMIDSIADTVYVAKNIEIEPKVTFKVKTVDFETNDTTVTDSILVKGVDIEYTYANNRNAGTATVYVTAKDSSNFEGTDSVTFVIKKAKALIDSVAVADTLVFNNRFQGLYKKAVVGGADSISSGVMKYWLTADTTAVPAKDSIWVADSVLTAKNAGDYKVFYYVQGNDNHFDSDTLTIKPKINKAILWPTSVKPVADTLNYNGRDQELYTRGTVIGVDNDTLTNAMRYSVDRDTVQTPTWVDSVIVMKNVGEYKVYYQVVDQPNYEDWKGDSLYIIAKIDKAQAAVDSLNLPVAVDTLAYTGLAQNLLKADSLGLVTGMDSINSGTIYYSLTYDSLKTMDEQAEGTWSTTVPQYTNAKDTIVVYYYVKGNDNHLDSPVDTLWARIDKADITLVNPVPDTLTYNANNQNLLKADSIGSITGVNNEAVNKVGKIYYTLKTPATATDNDWTTTVPQSKNAVDSIAVYFKVTAEANYKDIEPDSVFAVINKAKTDTLVAPKALELTYKYDSLQYVQNDTIIDAQKLVSPGTVTGVDGENSGKMKYTLTPNDSISWNDSIPFGHDAGDYTVYYKIVGDSNHVDRAIDSVKVTIAKAQATMAMAEEYENGFTGDQSKTYGDANIQTNEVTAQYGYSVVNYVSNNPNVASVHYYTGEVTILGAGDATITARMKDHKNFIPAAAIKYDIHVNPFFIDSTSVTVNSVKEGLPQIYVEADAPKGTLKPEVVKDYELFYYDNPEDRNRVTEDFMIANPDDYIAVLTFFGNYEGFVEVPITVNPPAVVPGDLPGANGISDGVVDADDVEFFIDKLLEGDLPEPGDPEFESYDANGDGQVDIADAQAILNISLGLNWDGSLPTARRENNTVSMPEVVYNVSASNLGTGVTRYTVTLEGNATYTGFQMDAKGSVEFISEGNQAVSKMRSNTMTNGTHRVVGYGSTEASANGTMLYIDVMGEGNVDITNVVLTTANSQAIFAVPGTVTGIVNVNADTNDVQQTYDMSGRKVNNTTQKGVYILNGKKVVKK